MSKLFIHILNMSISASWIVIVAVVLRLLLKRAPKWVTVLLWGMVAIRLICPFTVESVLSLIPSGETVSPDIMMDRTPQIHSGFPAVNNSLNPIIADSLTPAPIDSANPLQIWIPVVALFWIIGVGIMLIYLVVSYWRLTKKTGRAVRLRGRIYQSEYAISPFVLGIVKPRIFLPFDVSEQDRDYVIAHEQAHIRRRDHWWKPLGFLLLAIHWFNPLMWLGYVLLCRDIEFACDEKVIKELDVAQKADYSQALLNCSIHRHSITACPLAFGEVGVQKRVRSVLSYKKPTFWLLITALVITTAVAVCFLTNPSKERSNLQEQSNITEFTESNIEPTTRQLTLEDVINLSKKGDALTWKDFEDYHHFITGSGLFIRYYKINELFSLSIGGDPYEEPPVYFNLHAHDVWNDHIDIRIGDVEGFIEAHKNNSPVQHISLGYHCSPVDNTGDGFDKMVQLGGMPPDAHLSSRQALATVVISNVTELQNFKKEMASGMNFDQSYPDTMSFNVATEDYTEDYFQPLSLILIYIPASTTGHRYALEYAAVSKDTLSIGISQITPDSGDTAMQGWLLGVKVPKNSMENVTQIDARVISEVSANSIAEGTEVVGVYVLTESKEIIKPSFVLYSNGTFTFTFSAVSSYLGVGDYILSNGRLKLQTADGNYVYCFNEIDGGMVFDAELSSEKLWYSDIQDDCVFRNRTTGVTYE